MLARQLVEERGATLAETARYLVVTSFSLLVFQGVRRFEAE